MLEEDGKYAGEEGGREEVEWRKAMSPCSSGIWWRYQSRMPPAVPRSDSMKREVNIGRHTATVEHDWEDSTCL